MYDTENVENAFTNQDFQTSIGYHSSFLYKLASLPIDISMFLFNISDDSSRLIDDRRHLQQRENQFLEFNKDKIGNTKKLLKILSFFK